MGWLQVYDLFVEKKFGAIAPCPQNILLMKLHSIR